MTLPYLDPPVFAYNGRAYKTTPAFQKLLVMFGHCLVIDALDTTDTTPDTCDVRKIFELCQAQEELLC